MFVSWSFLFLYCLGQDWQKSGKTGPPKGSFSIFKFTVWPSFHGSWPSWILHKFLPESRLLIGSAHLVLFQFLCEDQNNVCWEIGHATINGLYCPPWWPWTEITSDPSKILVLLLCPNLYCLLHDRPVSRETVCWGQGIVNVFGKPADGEDGVPKNHLPWDSIHASLILKEVSVYLVSANFLVLDSFVVAAVHIGQVTVLLQEKLQLDNFILCSATF